MLIYIRPEAGGYNLAGYPSGGSYWDSHPAQACTGSDQSWSSDSGGIWGQRPPLITSQLLLNRVEPEFPNQGKWQEDRLVIKQFIILKYYGWKAYHKRALEFENQLFLILTSDSMLRWTVKTELDWLQYPNQHQTWTICMVWLHIRVHTTQVILHLLRGNLLC